MARKRTVPYVEKYLWSVEFRRPKATYRGWDRCGGFMDEVEAEKRMLSLRTERWLEKYEFRVRKLKTPRKSKPKI